MSSMKFVHPPIRDAQEETAVATCQRCHGEIYRDEATYIWEGKEICLDCLKAAITAMLEDNPVQLANEIGLEVTRYT